MTAHASTASKSITVEHVSTVVRTHVTVVRSHVSNAVFAAHASTTLNGTTAKHVSTVNRSVHCVVKSLGINKVKFHVSTASPPFTSTASSTTAIFVPVAPHQVSHARVVLNRLKSCTCQSVLHVNDLRMTHVEPTVFAFIVLPLHSVQHAAQSSYKVMAFIAQTADVKFIAAAPSTRGVTPVIIPSTAQRHPSMILDR